MTDAVQMSTEAASAGTGKDDLKRMDFLVISVSKFSRVSFFPLIFKLLGFFKFYLNVSLMQSCLTLDFINLQVYVRRKTIIRLVGFKT